MRSKSSKMSPNSKRGWSLSNILSYFLFGTCCLYAGLLTGMSSRQQRSLPLAYYPIIDHCLFTNCKKKEVPDPTSNVAIVTINYGGGSKKYDIAMKNHQDYAEKHGYDWRNAVDYLDNNEKSVHPYMLKAFALKAIMEKRYEYVVWVDRDAIFIDHEISLESRLKQLEDNMREKKEYNLYISVESWAWLNSGVMVFRNNEFSRRLVDDWIDVYQSRQRYYDSSETILIGGVPKRFRDLFDSKWSCEDQGALIALLAGYGSETKWNTDKYDGLGKPHLLHTGSEEWAFESSSTVLSSKYQSDVYISSQEWFNTNPWDHQTYGKHDPFIFHFNGQRNKPGLIAKYDKCRFLKGKHGKRKCWEDVKFLDEPKQCCRWWFNMGCPMS